MSRYGILHDLPLIEAPSQLQTNLRMRALHLLIRGLPNIVQQPGPLRQHLIQPQLPGHQPRKIRHFLTVLKHILPIARPILQPP